MKSLQTIQKVFHVFQILAKIFMILSFVWVGLTFIGLLCGIVWYSCGDVTGSSQGILFSLTQTDGLIKMMGVLLSEMVFALTDAVLSLLTFRYFQNEQAAGTPFTTRGAEQIKALGIRTIVFPLVAVILSAVICAIFNVPSNSMVDRNGLSNISIGIVLILTSLIFRYGAELENNETV